VLSSHTWVSFSASNPRETYTTHSGLPFTPHPPKPTSLVSAKTSTHAPAGNPPSILHGLSSGSTQAPTLPSSTVPTVPSDERFQATMMTMTTVSPCRRRGNRARRLRSSWAGETGPPLGALNAQEHAPPTPPSNGVQPPVVEDQVKKSSESPSIQKHSPQPTPVESVVEDTSRMSIQTDDIPMPGSFFRKHHVVESEGGGGIQPLHRWLPRWLQPSKRS
jgi:hypothetical protein